MKPKVFHYFVLALILCLPCLIAAESLAPQAPGKLRPNIVLIIVDTLRADKLGIYGSVAPASREFDRIAKSAIIFEQMIAQSSWTRSSVASMLTGIFPHDAGVVKEKWDVLPETVPFIPEILKKAGYATIGLTANPQLNGSFGFMRGFDRYVESRVLFDWMKGEDGKKKASKELKIRKAEDILAEALRLVKEEEKRPLYLQILLMDVHAHLRVAKDEIDEDLKEYPDARYLQAVRNAMRPTAHFIEELRGILGGNTVIVVTADHGEGLKNHPDVSRSGKHGNLLYQSQIHVPFVVFKDGLPKSGLRIKSSSALLNLMPTLLDLAGIEQPAGLEGKTIASLMCPKAALPSGKGEPVFSHTAWRKGVDKLSVTEGEWIFIKNRDRWPGTDVEELQKFNEKQNGSNTNLIKEYANTAKRLRDLLGEFEKKISVAEKRSLPGEADKSKIDPEVVKQLRSLGYLQ